LHRWDKKEIIQENFVDQVHVLTIDDRAIYLKVVEGQEEEEDVVDMMRKASDRLVISIIRTTSISRAISTPEGTIPTTAITTKVPSATSTETAATAIVYSGTSASAAIGGSDARNV